MQRKKELQNVKCQAGVEFSSFGKKTTRKYHKPVIYFTNLLHSEHLVEECGQEHEVDAGERLLRVGDLARVLQRVLK